MLEGLGKKRKLVLKSKVKRFKRSKDKCLRAGCNKRALVGSSYCSLHGEIEVGEIDRDDSLLIYTGKYRADFHPMEFIKHSTEGLSLVEVAAKFKVSVGTIEGWCGKYKEMGLAFEVGKAMHESWWLSKGKDGLESRSFNTHLYKFLTAKVDAEEWSSGFND